MQQIKVFLIFQFLIFCKHYEVSNAGPMLGRAVRRVREREFSFIVSISLKTPEFDPIVDHICTGTLITREHVITAEHCRCSNLEDCKVLVGSNNLYEGTAYDMSHWISYEEWIARNQFYLEYEENDIAIAKLATSVSDPAVEPANLSTISSEDVVGCDAVIAGWGRKETQLLAIIMETAMVKVMSKENCLRRVHKLSPSKIKMVVPNSIICSSADPYILLDNGESGGPLLDTNNYLIGVNEGTSPKTHLEFHPKEVNVHSSIHYYRHFIMNVISIL